MNKVMGDQLLNGYMSYYFGEKGEELGQVRRGDRQAVSIQKKSVLPSFVVVDDDTLLLNTIVLQLADYGYRALKARDYTSLRAQIRERVPDVLLLDYSLPEKNGIQIWSELRRDSRFGSALGVVMSAYAEAKELAQKQRMAFIEKPFTIDDLLALIGSLGDGGGGRKTAQTKVKPQFFKQKRRNRAKFLYSGFFAGVKMFLS